MEKLLLGGPVSEYLDKQSLNNFNNYEKASGEKASLGAITIGDDPSSLLYVERKEEKAKELNVNFHWKKLNKAASKDDVVSAIDEYKSLNGVILQLPIPISLDKDELIDIIPSHLDVDGLTSNNLGTLFENEPAVVPATARAVIEIFKYYEIDLTGKDISILGRSRLVTAPLAHLLSTQKYNATVTVLHSKSRNINQTIKKSDIVISAIGKAYFFNSSHFKEGSIVIDIGISKKDEKSYGDVNPIDTDKILYARTPFPGGVGPVTVSALYANLAKLVS